MKKMMSYTMGRNDNNYNEENEDHPDISHIPNDEPIPSQNPEKEPVRIPTNEPSMPGPIEAPIREPNSKPKIRVLNIEY